MKGKIFPKNEKGGVKLLMEKIMKGGAYLTKISMSANSVGRT